MENKELFSGTGILTPSCMCHEVPGNNSIPTKVSELENDLNFITENDKIELLNEIEKSTSDLVGKKLIIGDSKKGGEIFNNYTSNKAFADYSHAEGSNTQAIGQYSHAEGASNSSKGQSSHSEGFNNISEGCNSHSEGSNNWAQGDTSHVEGFYSTAIGNMSHAEGNKTTSYGNCSHIEGESSIPAANLTFGDNSNKDLSNATDEEIIDKWKLQNFSLAKGINSHVEGRNNLTFGDNSHAEGLKVHAVGDYSHAEGFETKAKGRISHAEGNRTESNGPISHSEGWETIAIGDCAHTEGSYTKAIGDYSHAEGYNNITANEAEHAEGKYNKSNLFNRGEESLNTISSIGIGLLTQDVTIRKNAVEVFNNGDVFIKNIGGYDGTNPETSKHVAQVIDESLLAEVGKKYINEDGSQGGEIFNCSENNSNIAKGSYSHAEGYNNRVTTAYSHSEGYNNTVSGESAHSEGSNNNSLGYNSHTEGSSNYASNECSHTEGFSNNTNSNYSHTEGVQNINFSLASHVEGMKNIVDSDSSKVIHVEGANNNSSGNYSHTEGKNNTTTGESSHTEGDTTAASGYASHSEGVETIASGHASHAEGNGAIASGSRSHAEGCGTTASGLMSHAEGDHTTASGHASHACGGLFQQYIPSPEENISLKGIKLLTTPNGNGYYSTNVNKFPQLVNNYGIVNGFEFSIDSAETRYIYDKLKFVNSTNGNGGQLVIFLQMPQIQTTCDPIPFTITSTGNKIAPVGAKMVFIIQLTGPLSQIYNIEKIDDNTARIEILPKRNSLIYYYNVDDTNLKDLTIQSIYNYKYYQDNPDFESELTQTIFKLLMPAGARLLSPACISAGDCSFTSGMSTAAIGKSSHAEGIMSRAIGDYSHTEGSNTTARGDYSHAEGLFTTASGEVSHAEGDNTIASGDASHAGGFNTIANNFAETTIGQYNIKDTSSVEGRYDATKPLFVVGNGTSDALRSDALRLSGEGKLWIQGVGDYTGTNPSTDNSLQNVLKTITTVDFSDYYNKKAVDDKLQGKQNTLIGKEIEGQNIKTINGLDITGKGNIQIEGGGGSSTPIIDSLDSTSTTAALSANQGRILNEDKVGQQQFIAYQGQVSGELDNRALHSEIPVNLSQLTNDTGYVTQNEIDKKASISYVDTKDTLLNTKIDTSNVSRFFEIIATTPDNYRAASTEKGKVCFDTRTKAFVWESGGYYYKNGTNSSSYNNDSGGALKDKLFMFKDTDDLDELYTYNAASGLAKVKTIDTTNIISSDTTNKIPTSQAVLSYVSNKLYKNISGGSFDVFGNVEDSGVYTIINNDSMPLGTLNVYCSFGNTFIIQTLISVFDLDEQGHLIHNPQYKKHPSIVSRMKRLIANSEKPSIPVGVWTPWEYISTPEIVNKADKRYVDNLAETLVDKNTFNKEISDLDFDIANKESISKTNKYLTQPFDSIEAVSNVKNESTLDVNAKVIFNTLSKKFVWLSGVNYYNSHPNSNYYNNGDTICKNKLYLSKGKIYVYDERVGLKEFKTNIKTINGVSLEGSGDIITIGKPGVSVTGEVFNDYTNNAAQGNYSHAEGSITLARGDFSHVEGKNNASVGAYSHAGGRESITRGDYSFAHGYSVAANNYGQTTFGINSISDAENASPNGFNKDKPLFLIGNGEDSSNRSNALLMNGYGTTWIEGIGDYDGTNPTANNSLQNIIKNAASGNVPKLLFKGFTNGITPEERSFEYNEKTDHIIYDLVRKLFFIRRKVDESTLIYYNWSSILNDYITGTNPGQDTVKSNVIFELVNPLNGDSVNYYIYSDRIKGLVNIDGTLINIRYSGTTKERPNPVFLYPGFRYFDTDLNEPIYFTKDSKWVNANGEVTNILHSGRTINRPDIKLIQDGFTYLDTDIHKVIFKFNTMWVDANGVKC